MKIEFLGKSCQQLFKENQIVYKTKIGQNKAFIAEHYIYLVKKYLYMTLRGTLNQNWVEVLEKIVNDMNNTPIKRLGFLRPNQIHSEIDSVFVKNAQNNIKLNIYKEPSWKSQFENVKNYESDFSKIQIGNYVYRDIDEKIFDKSFNVSVNSLNFDANILILKMFYHRSCFKKFSTGNWSCLNLT